MPSITETALINLTDAAALYGVSTSTINCFIETGYLRVKAEKPDAKFISRRDLAAVFGAPLQDAVSVEQMPEDAVVEKFEPEVSEESYDADLNESDVEPPQVTAQSNLSAPAADLQSQHANEIELLKLRNIIAVQEQLLKTRTEQLTDIRSERDWLKSRVERMEQASQREQLLLLAESETVRKLVSSHSRSPVRAALEWLGFTEPANQDRGTITVSQAANE